MVAFAISKGVASGTRIFPVTNFVHMTHFLVVPWLIMNSTQNLSSNLTMTCCFLNGEHSVSNRVVALFLSVLMFCGLVDTS